MERVELMNPENNGAGSPPQPSSSDIPPASNLTDYMLNAKEVNRLVYCRFGEKYVNDLERRKNSNIASLNAPTVNMSSATYLINIKKLMEEHGIDGEKRDFKSMKTG